MRLCAGWLVAAFMCALVVFPAAGSEGPRWLKIKSPNFELFTTAGERNGREVSRHFEQVRALFLEAMGLGLKSGPPVRIVVFRSDKELAPYAPNEFAAAFYLGAEDRDYIVMKSASGEHFPVAVHEYIHLLVKHSGIAAPVWIRQEPPGKVPETMVRIYLYGEGDPDCAGGRGIPVLALTCARVSPKTPKTVADFTGLARSWVMIDETAEAEILRLPSRWAPCVPRC
jgi:hypothetical protein